MSVLIGSREAAPLPEGGIRRTSSLFRNADPNLGVAMKTSFSAFTAPLLLAGAMHIQPADANLQIKPAPGFSVEIMPETPPSAQSPVEERLEERLRERLYGSGSEEWLEERVREERIQRGHCHRIANPIEREACFDDLEADPK
jgi:hypothetical protein